MNIAAKLNQSVTYALRSGVGNAGDPTYGSQSTISARVEARQKILPQPDGTERQSTHVIYTATQIPLGARVWLPGASTGNNNHARTVLTANEDPSLGANQTLYQAFV